MNQAHNKNIINYIIMLKFYKIKNAVESSIIIKIKFLGI